jgi:hypothetical protein
MIKYDTSVLHISPNIMHPNVQFNADYLYFNTKYKYFTLKQILVGMYLQNHFYTLVFFILILKYMYCIENPYWTRRRRHQVQYGFSIQYERVQYISILYITLYNELFIIQLK